MCGCVPLPRFAVWKQSGPQLMYGMFLNWGQWVICLLLTGLFLVPVFGVPKLFATIADVGFAGGHGTAAGLAPTYRQLGWDGGSDVALVAATVGLIISILMGQFGGSTKADQWCECVCVCVCAHA